MNRQKEIAARAAHVENIASSHNLRGACLSGYSRDENHYSEERKDRVREESGVRSALCGERGNAFLRGHGRRDSHPPRSPRSGGSAPRLQLK